MACLFDTHNDLRLAVDALSGGSLITIYAGCAESVRLAPPAASPRTEGHQVDGARATMPNIARLGCVTRGHGLRRS